MYENVNTLFDYIRDAGICHTSRVSDRARDDNVTIRLRKNDIESALKSAGFSKVKTDHHKSKPWITVIAKK